MEQATFLQAESEHRLTRLTELSDLVMLYYHYLLIYRLTRHLGNITQRTLEQT